MTTLIVARGQTPSSNGGDPDDDLNHIYNGYFELGIEGWNDTSGGDLISHETADPISGDGSLKVTIESDSGGAGAFQRIQPITFGAGQNYVGQTWRLTFDYRGDNTALMVYLYWQSGADDEALYITATPTVQSASVDFVVLNETYFDMQIVTNWNGDPQNNKTYVLDNVKLLKIADAP